VLYSGEALADTILQQLEKWQLHPQHMRGQAYDGAGAMTGKTKGVAARICALYPKAQHTHCAAHRLNLCVVKCCSIIEVNNVMHTVDSISQFFSASPKRQQLLDKWITDTLPSEEKRKKLKKMRKTRWVERHEAFEVFCDLFIAIYSCLEEIVSSPVSEWNRESRAEAHTQLTAISKFSFIATLLISQRLLSYTKGLSVKLQGAYVDVARAFRDVTLVKTENLRQNIDTFHCSLYQEILRLAGLVESEECSPRVVCRQQHRQNAPSVSCEEHYKVSVTIPILDHLIAELNDRFDNSSTFSVTIIEFMQLLPSEIIKREESLSEEDFLTIIRLYRDDLPSHRGLGAELDLWVNQWLIDSNLAATLNTPEKVLGHVDEDYFPNIKMLFIIMATLPITSCECERSISALGLIKTNLRSTMTSDRLNALVMMHHHRDIQLNGEEVVKEYAKLHTHRLLLVNPLLENDD